MQLTHLFLYKNTNTDVYCPQCSQHRDLPCSHHFGLSCSLSPVLFPSAATYLHPSKVWEQLKQGGNLLALRGSHPLGRARCKEHLQLSLCSASFPQIPWPAPNVLAPLSHALWECSAQPNTSPRATQIKSSVDPSVFTSRNFSPSCCMPGLNHGAGGARGRRCGDTASFRALCRKELSVII